MSDTLDSRLFGSEKLKRKHAFTERTLLETSDLTTTCVVNGTESLSDVCLPTEQTSAFNKKRVTSIKHDDLTHRSDVSQPVKAFVDLLKR